MIGLMLEGNSENQTSKALMLILEPGNIVRLKKGDPILRNLGEFVPELANVDLILAYTPDSHWVAKQLMAKSDLIETLQNSLGREAVFPRDPDDAEEMTKVHGFNTK